MYKPDMRYERFSVITGTVVGFLTFLLMTHFIAGLMPIKNADIVRNVTSMLLVFVYAVGSFFMWRTVTTYAFDPPQRPKTYVKRFATFLFSSISPLVICRIVLVLMTE